MNMNPQADLPFEHFPLVDAIDHEILMHRDAHFGGKFSIMLDYYQKEGRGVQPEFDLSRIDRLALLEEQIKQNLAALFLTAHEMQKVADSRAAYQKLREIYEIKKPKTPYPRLIVDLILTEAEEPEEEIAAIYGVKDKIVPALIDLLRSEELYDPLFPGYGQAPFLAVQALSQIGDKRAIISLFEALGQGDFFADELIIKALKAIGDPAKEFLIHVVNGRPINEDNERAAIGLIAFKDEEKVASLCLDLLQQSDVQKDPCLPTYLALCCAGLQDSEKRAAFKILSEDKRLPSLLRKDMEGVIHEWNFQI
jgi:hypothetical protein